MTPLVREMASLDLDSAVNYHWFDISEKPDALQGVYDPVTLSAPLPFEKIAIVSGRQSKLKLLLLVEEVGRVEDVENVRSVLGVVIQKGVTKYREPFTYAVQGSEVKISDEDSGSRNMLYLVNELLASLSQGKVRTHTVKRRLVTKGKGTRPVPMYDWTTIEIEPPKPKSEPQGGTHASPRQHDRRGHFRTLKSGKKVWVRQTVVGDPTKGRRFADYVVKGV